MYKNLIIIFLCFFCRISDAQTAADDDNVSISNKYESYEYKIGNNQTVIVDAKASTTYRCDKFRTNIPIVETYNDNISITDVSIFADGKRIRYIKPEYTYHSVENIFYSDARLCRFVLPLTSKGSSSEVQFKISYNDPRYFARIWLQNYYRTDKHQVEIIVPRWMKVSVHEMNFSGNISKEIIYDAKKDADIYRYNITGADALKHEEHAPGASYVSPHLLILNQYADTPAGRQVFFPGLDELYAWYRSLMQQVNNDEQLLKNKAVEIAKDCVTDIERIKSVYAWVQKNVRYIAFEDGIAGFKPDNAQEVLRKHYGDCKGMANLTKNLLTALGLDARVCWLGTNHIAYDYSLPSLVADNHMICAVMYEDSIYYLDATNRYLGFGQYPEHIQGRQVLIENGDKYLLERIPNVSYLQNTDKEIFRMEIEGNAIKGHAVNNIFGESKAYFMHGLNSFRKENQNEALMTYYSPGGDNFELTGWQHTGMDAHSPETTIEYDFKWKNAVQTFGEKQYIGIDFRKELLFSEIDTTKRKQDYWFPYRGHIVQKTELLLPDNSYVHSLPEALHIERDNYRFDISFIEENGKIIYSKELIMNHPYLSTGNFAQWNSDVGRLKKTYLEQIVISVKKQP